MENVVKMLEMTDIVEEAKDLQKAAEQFLVDNRKDLTPQLKQDLRNYSNGMNLMFKICLVNLIISHLQLAIKK